MRLGLLRARYERRVLSPLGWPVPAGARRASAREMATLIETARERGYSRTAKGYEPAGPDAWCAIVAVLYESTPEPAWICIARQSGGGGTYRVDIAPADFARLRRLRAAQKDALIQQLMVGDRRGGSPRD
ncbi:hypothetical protein [Streptomyces radicis]|uniref:Uncharacterized protein n=1 Tax=Streptomyces radicis TaxID=1750517 RepID=A0A3A9WXG9_9ACTN|nr:hypothetical protein [Streptomyces radicis]RKN12516.1 hypothetical protein D7319_00690 [Streptomyces radicis]RKN27718.1 hypothetical protein D7318_02205 [Streptomyces radicis]